MGTWFTIGVPIWCVDGFQGKESYFTNVVDFFFNNSVFEINLVFG